MAHLTILHETRYSYSRAVGFGVHRMLLRPRDSHAIRLIDASLSVTPAGDIRWQYDALGNCVCLFTPAGVSDHLTISSRLVIERFPAPLAPVSIQDPQTAQPIVYGLEDRAVLAPFMNPVAADASGGLLRWLRGQVGDPFESATAFLLRLNGAIHDSFEYRARFEPGTQEPEQTILTGSGTCRDFAWLMVEALRRMGFAARFVTGYLYSPGGSVRGAGATHAWCEVFLPDLGWTEFDPTNALAESADLIPVAVTRTPADAIPIAGSTLGDPGYSELRVDVEVTLKQPLGNAA